RRLRGDPPERHGRRRGGGAPPPARHVRALPRGPREGRGRPGGQHGPRPAAARARRRGRPHRARGAEAFLGLGYWELGELELASRWFADGMASLERAGYLADVVGGSIVLADLEIAQGRLGGAHALYTRGMERATRAGPPILRGAADMHVGLSDVAYERGDLAAAADHLAAAEQLGEVLAFPRFPYRSRLARARILGARGDVDGALEQLAEAERLYRTDFSPDIRPIPAVRARLLVGHGRIADARAWARTSGIDPAEEATYLHEFRLLTLARLLTAEGSTAEAVELTGSLLTTAEERS